MNPSLTTRHRSRILVRGTNWLGDAVMSTPALLRLREKFPNAHIALLTPEKLRELWLHHPAVDETISFVPGESIFSIGKKLRTGKFDLALVLPNSPRSAMEVFFARIPQRIGYARPWRNFFLTQTILTRPGHTLMRKRSVTEIRQLVSGADFQPESEKKHAGWKPAPLTAHQMHEYLHLVAALGANPEPLPPQLFVTAEEVEAAKKRFGLENFSNPIFGLNPGAEYGAAKRWPIDNFAAAASKIQKQTGGLWILFGGKADEPLVKKIWSVVHKTPLTHINLAGRTSLRELMALLKICRVLLTNDTGPMHVAAALGTPVVVPFGSTSPELTGPGLPGDPIHHLLKSNVSCSPCFLRECPIDFRCMNGISVERVVEAVLEFKL